jgi:outer membrane protein assembly factor BamE (lipoprotein component of BamABCDE complex)
MLARCSRAAALALLLLISLVPAACGPSAEERRRQQQAAVSDAEWAWLQQAKHDLDERRARLAQAPPDDADPARRQAEALAEELDRRLVAYINATVDDASPDRQLAAIRIKSDEDIVLARQFIERGGDYRRAIEIYESALAVDPDNPRLRAELQAAQARRYITPERFSQIKEGMDQPQVRALLGQPNLQDVRSFPERNVTAWFYPKDASGAAAGIWFEKQDGAFRVYELDFDAVQAPGSPGAAPQLPPTRKPATPRPPKAPGTPTSPASPSPQSGARPVQ